MAFVNDHKQAYASQRHDEAAAEARQRAAEQTPQRAYGARLTERPGVQRALQLTPGLPAPSAQFAPLTQAYRTSEAVQQQMQSAVCSADPCHICFDPLTGVLVDCQQCQKRVHERCTGDFNGHRCCGSCLQRLWSIGQCQQANLNLRRRQAAQQVVGGVVSTAATAGAVVGGVVATGAQAVIAACQ